MTLTPQQKRVAELLSKPMTGKAAAKELGVSVHTVYAHVRDAARRIPGPGRAKDKLIVWFHLGDEES